MPKTPIDYQKSVIYKIQHIENLELIYIGSTTNFNKRKQHHKEGCNTITNKKYNYLVYKMIRDNGGWEQFKMIIIKEYPCETKIELLIEEDRLMREMKTNMNNNKAYLTDNDRRERDILRTREYRQNNIEKCKQYDKDRYLNKINCECGSCICIKHKARHLNSLKHINFIKK